MVWQGRCENCLKFKNMMNRRTNLTTDQLKFQKLSWSIDSLKKKWLFLKELWTENDWNYQKGSEHNG